MTTYTELKNGFAMGPWEVLPDRGLIRDGEREEHLEPMVMDVLVVLASEQGDVVSKDRLIELVWKGRAQSDEPLNRCISVLRKKLGDDSRNPTFIENIPRRGYRLMIPLTMATSSTAAEPAVERRNWLPWVAAGAAMGILLFAALSLRESPTDLDSPMQSVAIFSFTCAGTTEEYLCFGFSEELTSTLSQAQSIRIVRSREPMPTDAAPQSVAAALDVDGLLTGSVQQIGDQLKISAELVDGRNGFIVMSDTLDGSVADVFDLQERVAGVVEQSIFGESEVTLEAASRPSSFAAFQAYARGQYQFETRSKASIERAIELFEETISLDPNFGPAYLRQAYAYLLLPEYDSSLDIEAMYDLAAAKTEAGIAADPSIRDPAGTVFGFIHHKRGEWLQATEAFERAVSGATVYPESHHWYSRFLATVGRLDDSLYHSRRAAELDPDSAIILSRMGIINFWMSDLDEARRYFEMVNNMTLDAPIHDLAYALFLIRSGDFDAARVNTRSGLEKNGLPSEWVDPVFDGIEDPAMRQQSYDLVAQIEATGALPSFVEMTLWSLLGDADRAMATALSIEGIGQEFETGLEVMFSDELAIIREHRDFPVLLEKTGLTQYWAEVGCRLSEGRVSCD